MDKRIVIIPSRYSSSRFPGKPRALILGKPMIQHVYERVRNINEIDDVVVATDDVRIFSTVQGFGGKAVMTSEKHQCGTDRIAECSDIIKAHENDLIINVQGDEPLIQEAMLLDLLSCFANEGVYMATLKKEIQNPLELDDPNVVKVVTDTKNNAIYFSRFCIPYERNETTKHFKHIGIYGYKKWFLDKLSHMPRTPLEQSESLEQLRVLENSYNIMVSETKYQTIGVDTPEQLLLVEKEILKNG